MQELPVLATGHHEVSFVTTREIEISELTLTGFRSTLDESTRAKVIDWVAKFVMPTVSEQQPLILVNQRDQSTFFPTVCIIDYFLPAIYYKQRSCLVFGLWSLALGL